MLDVPWANINSASWVLNLWQVRTSQSFPDCWSNHVEPSIQETWKALGIILPSYHLQSSNIFSQNCFCSVYQSLFLFNQSTVVYFWWLPRSKHVIQAPARSSPRQVFRDGPAAWSIGISLAPSPTAMVCWISQPAQGKNVDPRYPRYPSATLFGHDNVGSQEKWVAHF